MVLYILIGIIIGLICVILYTVGRAIDIYAKNASMEFNVKMAMAEAQSKSMAVKSFEELRKDLDYIISLYVAHETMVINFGKLKDDEKSDMITEHVSDISAKVIVAMSDEFVRQMLIYTTADFLEYYVMKSVTTMVTAIIKQSMKNH